VNAGLKAATTRLDAEVRDLKEGTEAIEERARSELGIDPQGRGLLPDRAPAPGASREIARPRLPVFFLAAYDRRHRTIALTIGLSLLVHGIDVPLRPVRDRTGEEAGSASAGHRSPERPADAAGSPRRSFRLRRCRPPLRRRRRAASASSPHASPARRPRPGPWSRSPLSSPSPFPRRRWRRRPSTWRRSSKPIASGGAWRKRRRLEAEGTRAFGQRGRPGNLSRNLRSLSRSDGTGGVFQIRRMGAQDRRVRLQRLEPVAPRAMALAQPGQGASADIAHARAQPAHQLEHIIGERPLIRHPAFDPLRTCLPPA